MSSASTIVCRPDQHSVSGADCRHDQGASGDRRRPTPDVNLGGPIAAGAVVVVCILARIPNRLVAVAGLGAWAPALVGVLALVNGARVVAQAPFTFVGRSGSVGRWATGQLATLAAAVAVGSALTIPLYALIRASAAWWLWAWALFAVVTVAGQAAMPFVVRLQSGPLVPAPEPVAARVRAIAARSGVDLGSQVLVASKRPAARNARGNAYVVGLGRGRRLVLESAVLSWPSEVLDQVVAHEMGHWRLRHIRQRLPLTVTAQLVTFALAAWVLSWTPLLHAAGVAHAGDPRSYPLLLLLTVVLVLPARLMLAGNDRAQERAADRFALAVLESPEAFVAMLEQAAESGAPRRLPGWRRLVASHPPLDERIALCRSASPSASAPASPLATQGA